MVYIIWTLMFLGICTVTDIKNKNIYTYWCVANGVAGIIVNIALKNFSLLNLGAGLILGLIFILSAVLTKQKIGIGDGIVILTVGLIVGGVTSFQIVVWAFLCCSVVSSIGIAFFKFRRNQSFAFIPFMLLGSVITFMMQGGIK